MTALEKVTEILACVALIGAWLALSWRAGPLAFACMAAFTACGILSIPYHLCMERKKDE